MTEEPILGWTEVLGEHAANPSNPQTVGDTIAALGREWTVSLCEMRIKAQFETWVRRNAKKAVAEAEMEEGPEEANHLRSAYLADLGAGHYSWDGRHVRSARSDLPGLRYLVFLLLRRCHPSVTEAQVETIFEENARGCGISLRWALGNSKAPPSPARTNGASPRTLDAL